MVDTSGMSGFGGDHVQELFKFDSECGAIMVHFSVSDFKFSCTSQFGDILFVISSIEERVSLQGQTRIDIKSMVPGIFERLFITRIDLHA